MKIFITILWALFSLFATSSAYCQNGSLENDHELRIVISEGRGSDIASAAQNAAFNALTNVVGSFVDASKAIEKRVQIQDGLRVESKKISTDIKEYSQGTIKKFEIMESGMQGQFVFVRARVTVRNDDFKSYIKKIAEVEIKLDNNSLFAQAETERKQANNKSGLLLDNVIKPIASAGVIVFNVSPPYPLSQVTLTLTRENNAIIDLSNKYGKETIFIFKIRASLSSEFVENLNMTLGSISQSSRTTQITYRGFRDSGHMSFMGRNLGDDLYIHLLGNGERETERQIEVNYGRERNQRDVSSDEKARVSMVYGLSDMRSSLTRSSDNLRKALDRGGNFESGNLEVNILDASGKSIQNELFGARLKTNKMAVVSRDGVEPTGLFSAPWSLIGKSRIGNIAIMTSREFDVIISIDGELMRVARSVKIAIKN